MELITPIIQRDTSWKEKMRMVSLLIGQEAFEELLMLLPDEFFGRDESGKYTGWSDILRVANQGERDPERLAKQVKRFIDL